MPEVTSIDDVARILANSRTVAVLGAHPNQKKPAHFVPAYLHEQGYEVVPVNPGYPDVELWGTEPAGTLAELQEPIHVVDVFRRSEHLAGHVPDILAMDPLPRVVWFQAGIRNDDAARRLIDAGIDVVQDACMLALHKKLGMQRIQVEGRSGEGA